MNKYQFFFFILFVLLMINLTATALEIQVNGFPDVIPQGDFNFITFILTSIAVFIKLLAFQVVGGIPVLFSALLYPFLLTLLWYIIGMARGSS